MGLGHHGVLGRFSSHHGRTGGAKIALSKGRLRGQISSVCWLPRGGGEDVLKVGTVFPGSGVQEYKHDWW